MGSPEVIVFEDDDEAYSAHVSRHGGWVLVELQGEWMLHDADCHHVTWEVDPARSMTHNPRYWASSRRALDEWLTSRQVGKPPRCQSCQ